MNYLGKDDLHDERIPDGIGCFSHFLAGSDNKKARYRQTLIF